MSGGGSSITLSHTYFTSTCTSSGCDVTIKFTPPQDTTVGTKTLLISSKSCSLSQAEVQLSIQSSTAEVVPSRAQAAGGETLSLYVVNAPTSSALPFDFSNVRVECGSSQATVTYVSPHTAESTTVRFDSASLVLDEAAGETQRVTSCKVYRQGDSAKAGATFDITYYLGAQPYIRDLDVVESSAVGNQFGGVSVRVTIVNLPAADVSSVMPIIKFGNTLAAFEVIERSGTEAILQITSPAISQTDYDTSSTQTVTIAPPYDASKFVTFSFQYNWVMNPMISAVQPDSASTAGGTVLTLQIADVSPSSVASDVTVVFQQGSANAKQATCSSFEYKTSERQGLCTVSVPTGLAATAGSSADPAGLSVFTAQQGRSKIVDIAFTYYDDAQPQIVDSWVMIRTYVTVIFDNYCTDMTSTPSGYGLSVTTDSQSYTPTYVFGTYGQCQTDLTIQVPELTVTYTLTVTLGGTGKSVAFTFHAAPTSLTVTSSLTSSIVRSSPEVTLTLDNVKATDGSGLCHIDSCRYAHNLKVLFGPYTRGAYVASECVHGLCKIRVQAPILISSGDMTVQV